MNSEKANKGSASPTHNKAAATPETVKKVKGDTKDDGDNINPRFLGSSQGQVLDRAQSSTQQDNKVKIGLASTADKLVDEEETSSHHNAKTDYKDKEDARHATMTGYDNKDSNDNTCFQRMDQGLYPMREGVKTLILQTMPPTLVLRPTQLSLENLKTRQRQLILASSRSPPTRCATMGQEKPSIVLASR